MMKEQKIYMRTWTEMHGRAKVMATDEWYLNLVNELLPLVASSYMYQGREMVEDQRRVGLSCALNREDCTADAGNWRGVLQWA